MAHEYPIWDIYELNGSWNIFNDPWNATLWWQKFSWPWETFSMGCVKDSSIIHGKSSYGPEPSPWKWQLQN